MKSTECVHTKHSYTHLIPSSSLNECLLVHNFQNSCSTDVTDNTWRKRVSKYDCTINEKKKLPKGVPAGIFSFTVILTISYLRAWTIETSSLPNDFMRPLIKQIETFSGILTVYFNCKYFSTYTRELLGCLLGISPFGKNFFRGN